MARVRASVAKELDYPTSDGKPMAETDLHRNLMIELIAALQLWFAANQVVYVSGNLLVFYQPGNRRRHVSPDVFVVRGVPKRQRDNYLIWEEGKAPELAIEITSKTTRREDLGKKFALYQDTLKVQEYFLFDPYEDYLKPPMQGYRLRRGRYVGIKPAEGRLPSEVLGLHLERHGTQLRLYNPATQEWLPTEQERIANTEAQLAQVRDAQQQAEAEIERLRRELEALRQGLSEKP